MEQISRELNSGADALAKLDSQEITTLLGVIPLKVQKVPSILEVELMNIDVSNEPTWTAPIYAYVKKGTLQDDKAEGRRLRYKAAMYAIYDGLFYRRGFNMPLLKCIDGEECNIS